MKKIIALLAYLTACLAIARVSYAEQTIVAQKVEQAPVVDGVGNDPAWQWRCARRCRLSCGPARSPSGA